MLLVGLVDAPIDMSEDDTGALKDINGDSPFAQTLLKFVEARLQVADEHLRLA